MTTDDPASEEEHPSLMAHSTPILSSFFDSHFSIGAYFATAKPEANGIWIFGTIHWPILCDGNTRSKAVPMMAYHTATHTLRRRNQKQSGITDGLCGFVACLTFIMGYESSSITDFVGGLVTW